MKMEDLVIISVDDHITEPGTVFDKHLTGDAYASAPKLRTTAKGTNYWEYQGKKIPSTGLNAVVGRPKDEYGMEPTALSQLRAGCYDVNERVDDMNINGMAASLNFASFPGFDGGLFIQAPDKAAALTHLRAYNDWHVDEWCGAHPGRFIPCGLLPTWDMDATVAEIKRLKAKGCNAVSINENPTKRGLPSIHNAYWEPLWKAATDLDIVLCLHIGGGNPAPHASHGDPGRSLDHHHADVDRRGCGRLADAGRAEPLPDHEDGPLRRRHRLGAVFHGARRFQPWPAPCLDPFRL